VSTGYSNGGQDEPWSPAEKYNNPVWYSLALLILMFLASLLGILMPLDCKNLTASGGCTPGPP